MNSVFEKIIEELEKLDVKAIKRYKGGTFGDYEGTDYYIKKSDAIEIVKQEAEQHNNGFNDIVEIGLPPVGKPLIVTVKDNLQGRPNELRYPVYYEKDSMKGGYHWSWRYGDFAYELVPDVSEVIAWQPLPQPFQKGE